MSKKKKIKEPTQNPYFVDKLASIPAHVKIGFLKFWLAGASFYLTVNGLPQVFDYLDRLVVLTLVLILGIEYISNTMIYWMHTDSIDTKKYLPHEINRKSAKSIGMTALYVIVMMVLFHMTLTLYVGLGMPTIGDILSESTADPFTFGFIFLGYDYLWMLARRNIKQRRKEKNV